jgi:hypothetical protein
VYLYIGGVSLPGECNDLVEARETEWNSETKAVRRDDGNKNEEFK